MLHFTRSNMIFSILLTTRRSYMPDMRDALGIRRLWSQTSSLPTEEEEEEEDKRYGNRERQRHTSSRGMIMINSTP